MLEINQEDTFVLAEDIFLQKIAELGKYWVFNINTGEHYTLNETSYWILEQIAESLSIRNILMNYLDNFDVDENQGKDDFNDIIDNFLNEGIIKQEEGRWIKTKKRPTKSYTRTWGYARLIQRHKQNNNATT